MRFIGRFEAQDIKKSVHCEICRTGIGHKRAWLSRILWKNDALRNGNELGVVRVEHEELTKSTNRDTKNRLF